MRLKKLSRAVLAGVGALAIQVGAHEGWAAYDYSDAVQTVFEHEDGANSNPDVPLIYRDDNFSIQFQDDDRQFIFGAVAFTQLRAGSESIPAIRNISSDSFPRQNLDPGDETAPQIGGLFLAEIIGNSSVGPETSTHDDYVYMTSADSGSYSFTDASGDSVTIDWQPDNAGTLLQLFGQDSGFSYSDGPQAVWDNLIGMSRVSEIGFSGPSAGIEARYAMGDQYYAVGLDDINGTPVPNTLFGNLDVLLDDANVFPGVRTHDGGQLLHLFGDVSSGQAGDRWEFGGDGARMSFVIPEPGSLALLGLGGALLLGRRRRQ